MRGARSVPAGLALAFLLLLGPVSAALAASAQEDSTDAWGGLDDLAQMAEDAADSAAVDSTMVAPEGFYWVGPLRPEIKADVESNVSAVTKRGNLTVNGLLLGGAGLTTSFERENTSYRQQDRDTDTTRLNGSLDRRLGLATRLRLRFADLSMEDVNRLRTGDVVVTNDDRRGNLDVGSTGSVAEGHRHAWAARGEILDVSGSNRGTNNDRSLASGVVAGRWAYETDLFTLRGRGGYDRGSGTRQLRGQSSDASTVQDTLGTSIAIDRGRWFTMDASVDKIRFNEDRLDFRRSPSGVIDTLNIPDDQKVGRERETRDTDRLSLRASTRPLGRLSLSTDLGHDFTQTEFDFSQQGVLQKGSDRWAGEMGFRYAAAGSLKVRLSWSEDWNDRRTREDVQFRGRERRVNKEIGLSIKQRILPATSLDLGVSQRLNQNIFEEKTNKNDRDQLYERLDASVLSDAIPNVKINLGATINRNDQVNIAAERVGNNKEDRLYEVRGGWLWNATARLSLDQSYRMQIVYVDYHNSDDRDQFNKQGQFLNKARLKLPSGASLTAQYSVDFRQNGKRDIFDKDAVTYVTDLRRFDHQLRAGVNVPVVGLILAVETLRGFLRDENPSSGTENAEDRGEVRFRLEGSRKFWKKKAELRLNVQRVLAYGPRVRPENEDYWIANSGVTVRF